MLCQHSFLFERNAKRLCRVLYGPAALSCLLHSLFAWRVWRGGFTTAVRPITISNANQYVKPSDRGGYSAEYNRSLFFQNQQARMCSTIRVILLRQELDSIYSPLRNQGDAVPDIVQKKKNVVVLIVGRVSGREYIGAYNEKLEDGKI